MNTGNRPHDWRSPWSKTRLPRGLLGLVGALLFHVLFLGLIVFRLNPKPHVLPQVSQGYAELSLSMVRDTSSLSRPQSVDRTPAGAAQAKQPALAAPTAPALSQTPPEPAPRPQVAATTDPLVLSPLRPLLAAQDLHSEPMPLHSQAGPSSAGSAPSAAGRPECQLAPIIQQALQKDAGVVDALAGLPRQSRSVANAVMLWEQDWTLKPAGPAPITVIQTALKAAIAQSAQTCRDQPMRGPQFITVTDGPDTTVLVVGSGDWTWGQLLR